MIPVSVRRKRVMVVIHGGRAHNVLAKMQSAAANVDSFDMFFVQMDTQPQPEHTYYEGVPLPVLHPSWLLQDCAEVVVVCDKHSCANTSDRFLLVLDATAVDDGTVLDKWRTQSRGVEVVPTNLDLDTFDRAVRGVCELANRHPCGVVELWKPESDAWLRVREHCATTPWLSMAELTRITGSADVARRLVDLRCVVELAPDFIAVDMSWLFDMLRRVRIPALYTANSANYMWHTLYADRMVERKLLNVLWHEQVDALRDALAQYFERVGAFGARVPARPPCGDMWMVPHLVWANSVKQEETDAAVGIRGWRVLTAVRHCQRRRIEIRRRGVWSLLWRDVVAALAHVQRCSVTITLGYIKVQSLDDDETVVMLARQDTIRRSQYLSTDIMAWYSAVSAGVMTFRLFAQLMPVIAASCVKHCGDAVVTVPLMWDGARAGLGWAFACDEASVECCRAADRHGSLGAVELPCILDCTVCDRVTLVHYKQLLAEAEAEEVWPPQCGLGSVRVVGGLCRLLAPYEARCAVHPRIHTPEPGCVSAHDAQCNAREQLPKHAVISWRSFIDWRDIVCAHDGTMPLRDAVCDYRNRDACATRYEPAGKGGFGAVWRGIWRGQEVGVKVVVSSTADANVLRMEEFCIMQRLSAHLNVVQLLGFCLQPAAIVMEFVAAGKGKATLTEWCRSDDFYAARGSELAHIAEQACAGLAYCHAMGVLHCDVKPSNVLMTLRADCWVPKISDFGVSKRLEVVDGEMTSVRSSAAGSRGFQAPEQALPCTWDVSSDSREYVITTKSDVWSFGVTLFRLFCGADNTASAVLVVDSFQETLMKQCHWLEKYEETFRVDLLPVSKSMRNALLFAKTRRRRALPTAALTLVEWCLRPLPQERPTMEQVASALRAMRENFAAAEAQHFADVWLGAVEEADAEADADTNSETPSASHADSELLMQLWDRAAAAWAAEAKRKGVDISAAPVVFFGLPCRFLTEEIGRHVLLDAAARDAMTVFLDATGSDVVSLQRVRHCVRGCADVPALVAKALRPLVEMPIQDARPCTHSDDELRFVCRQLCQCARDFHPESSSANVRAVQRRILAVTCKESSGNTRFLLEVAHTLRAERLFAGGVVVASALAALSISSLFGALCSAVHISAENDAQHAFRRWCATQSARGNVLLCVDGGTNNVRDIAQHMGTCLRHCFDLNSALIDGGCEAKIVPQPCRVFVLVAGCDTPQTEAVATALEAEPRVVACFQAAVPAAARVIALRDTMALRTRAVLTRLCAWRAPFDEPAARTVCGGELEAGLLTRLQEQGLLVRTSEEHWYVPDEVVDALKPLTDAVYLDTARVAFLQHYCAVLTVCADENAAVVNSGRPRYDAAQQSMDHVLYLAKRAMHQTAAVRSALVHLVDSVHVFLTLEQCMKTCELLEVFSALWLSTWTLPRTLRNARGLCMVSSCLSCVLFNIDTVADAQEAAELGVKLAENVMAAELASALAIPGAKDDEVVLQRLKRAGELVVHASRVLATALSEDKTEALFAEQSAEFVRLQAHTADQLTVLQKRFPLAALPRLRGVLLQLQPPLLDVRSMDRALLLLCKCLYVLRLYVHDAGHKLTAMVWHEIAYTLSDRNLKAAAVAAFERVIALDGCAHSPVTARALSSIAEAHHDMKNHAKALELYKRCVTVRRLVLGAVHADVARTLSLSGIVHNSVRSLPKALQAFEKCAVLRCKTLGMHPDVAASVNNHGVVMNAMMQAGAAAYTQKDLMRIYARCLAIRHETLGAFHPDVAQSLNNLSVSCFRAGMVDFALKCMERCKDVYARLGRIEDVDKCQLKLDAMRKNVSTT